MQHKYRRDHVSFLFDPRSHVNFHYQSIIDRTNDVFNVIIIVIDNYNDMINN